MDLASGSWSHLAPSSSTRPPFSELCAADYDPNGTA